MIIGLLWGPIGLLIGMVFGVLLGAASLPLAFLLARRTVDRQNRDA